MNHQLGMLIASTDSHLSYSKQQSQQSVEEVLSLTSFNIVYLVSPALDKGSSQRTDRYPGVTVSGTGHNAMGGATRSAFWVPEASLNHHKHSC